MVTSPVLNQNQQKGKAITLYTISIFAGMLTDGANKNPDLSMFSVTPLNAVTDNPSRGDACLRLQDAAVRKGYTSAEWATERQWSSLGGTIAEGQKPTRIDFVEVLKDQDDAQQRTPKYGWLFNRRQLAGE